MTSDVMKFATQFGTGGRVLEVGSLDVNGSVRNFYADYTGVDMRAGKNVDIVANGNNLPFEDESYDKVLSLESMEHDQKFWLTFAELVRVLKPGGQLIVTTRGIGFPKHEFPFDYYRFTAESLKALFEDRGLVDVLSIENTEDGGVFGYGKKVIV